MLSETKSRKAGKTLIQTLYFFLLVTQICFAQWKDMTDTIPGQMNEVLPIRLPHTSHTPGLTTLSLHPSFYDRKAEWQWIIDSTWGPGEALSAKLTTFDSYQEFARAYNATFLWNPINWDSLASTLRSRVTDSTSRGGFARILNDLTFGLKDGHAYAYNSVVLYTPLNPGIPILADGGGFINHFGAGLTPLEDSTLLVYKVVPNHPLGLMPGDIILGYEGVPWSQIVRELLAGGVPHTLFIGAAQSAFNRVLLWAAGESWHLFDTIDVVKYSTGVTEHLPLDSMVNLVAPSNYINNEQLSVPGVPMPTYISNCCAITYGIIDGTNIGYIYVWRQNYEGVKSEFDAAVLALMETDGLIIDIRTNWGGSFGLNDGISRLMNHSTYTLDAKKRCSPTDLYTLCPAYPSFWIGEIPADIGTFYDRPIAVLLGPNCLSYGDITSWQLSYVPNARMFGRSPMAIYSGNAVEDPQPYRPGYSMRCPTLTFVDHYYPELPRWGQEYPLFEEVWLTPEGVANGEDDVVKRAVEWMNDLVYPHTIVTDKTYYTPSIDSVHIYTTIENPNSNQISATAYLKTLAGVLIDSVNLSSLLLNSTGEQWSGSIGLPSTEDYYDISVTAFDNTNSEQFSMPNATRFTTVGPVKLDSIYISESGSNFSVKPFIKNLSNDSTITNLLVRLICNDPWVTSIAPTYLDIPDIPPGYIVSPTELFTVTIDTSIFQDYFNFKVEVISDGWAYWIDSMRVPPIAIININPTQLAFGEVAVDSSATKTFTITNYGDEDLVVSDITSSEPVFTVNISSAVVLPDSSQDVEVTFTPTEASAYNGIIEITHNGDGSPDTVIVTGDGVTGVDEELQPLIFSLEQNYPNPFNPSTSLKWQIPEPNNVTLKIFNILGEEVATLVNEFKPVGRYQTEFNASTLPSGVYFYQLRAGEFIQTKKMLLLK